MSNREEVLQRLEAAMSSLEAAAERRMSSAGQEIGQEIGQDSEMLDQLNAVTQERDRLAGEVEKQSKHNADLGTRLEKAIAKLNKVLESA